MPLNINGRICFVYSLFWGALGILWIKDLYPRMAKYILKIPNRAGKILTWALTAFLIVNAIVSCVAVGRWSSRVETAPRRSLLELCGPAVPGRADGADLRQHGVWKKVTDRPQTVTER